MRLPIELFDETCQPYRANPTDAGLDLKAARDAYIAAGQTEFVSTGIKVAIPENYVGLLMPRSGLSSKYGITLANSVGVIDSDYRGDVICALKNTSTTDFQLEKFTRIAQLLIVPIAIPEIEYVNELEQTNRGNGGFGSTGV